MKREELGDLEDALLAKQGLGLGHDVVRRTRELRGDPRRLAQRQREPAGLFVGGVEVLGGGELAGALRELQQRPVAPRVAGGRVEDNETIVQAALRETHEEIGLAPDSILPLGELSPLYVPVSTSLITPIVGYFTAGEPIPVASESEVEDRKSVV